MGLSIRVLIGWKVLFYGCRPFWGPIVSRVRLRLKTLLQSLSQTRLAHDFAKVSVVLNDKTTGPDTSGLRSLDHILRAARSQTDEQTAK